MAFLGAAHSLCSIAILEQLPSRTLFGIKFIVRCHCSSGLYKLHVNLSTVNENIQAALQVLIERYKQTRYIPQKYDWPPYHPKHYTPLTVIHHHRRCTESEVIDSAEELKSKGYTIHDSGVKNVSDIFSQFEGGVECPCSILIEGAPGIGKTILSKEVSLQWANHTILADKKLLFLLFMRDPRIKYITNVKSLVSYFFEKESLASKVTDWLLETYGQFLAIVLDGYDEVSEENQSNFIKQYGRTV